MPANSFGPLFGMEAYDSSIGNPKLIGSLLIDAGSGEIVCHKAVTGAHIGTGAYPDLVLQSLDRGRRLQVVVEVETGESVNHLEALAQWAHLSKIRAAFHLYVPAGMVDVARRLCEDSQIRADEIWSYHIVGDEPRFTLVHRSKEGPPKSKPAPHAAKPVVAPRPEKPAKLAKQHAEVIVVVPPVLVESRSPNRARISSIAV